MGQLCSLEPLMPQQRLATSVEGMEVTVDMEDTEVIVDMDIMERDQLKLMLSQDICPEDMVMEVMAMVVMDMAVDTMERGRLKPSQATSEDMVGMVVGMDMGVMDMADMAIMVNF